MNPTANTLSLHPPLAHLSLDDCHWVWSHGWALVPEYWTPMQAMVSERYPNATHTTWNHGYYDAPVDRALPNTDRPVIAVGHSLGFYHAAESGYPFAAYVCLQGFRWFCSPKKGVPGVPKAQVTGIKGLLSVLPNPTPLKPFFQLSGITTPLPAVLNRPQLLADLELLSSGCIDWPQAPVLVIISDDDLVVPAAITAHQAKQCPNVTVKRINGVKHALGYLAGDQVIEAMDEWLQQQ